MWLDNGVRSMRTMAQENGIFGLDEAQLLPVVEAAAGVPIARFTHQTRPLGGGYSSDTRLCEFRYATHEGRESEVTLFVKRCVWRPEAVHYRHLAAAGVPTPRLHGVLYNSSGEEIIFVERLPRIGFQRDSPVEWRIFLSLLARLNACEITHDYAPHLHVYEQVGTIGDDRWITGLNASPSDEEISRTLRSCGVEDRELPALQRAVRALFAQIEDQPRGLLHQDVMFDNLGWSGEEMVILDLQKLAFGPRFADVAPYLGLPDWSATAAFLNATETGSVSHREILTRYYLDEYARFGGGTVAMETFQKEARALFWAHKVSTLYWLRENNQQARVREVLDFLRHAPLGR
jgi:Phosphotransferase enzyme family